MQCTRPPTRLVNPAHASSRAKRGVGPVRDPRAMCGSGSRSELPRVKRLIASRSLQSPLRSIIPGYQDDSARASRPSNARAHTGSCQKCPKRRITAFEVTSGISVTGSFRASGSPVMIISHRKKAMYEVSDRSYIIVLRYNNRTHV